jgi:hypothetical protein
LKCKELVIFKGLMKREKNCMLLEAREVKKKHLSRIILIKQKNSEIWYYYAPLLFIIKGRTLNSIKGTLC